MKLEQKIESQVKKTLKKIGLKKDSKILVALSGGKDSISLIYILKKFGYKLEGIYIDLKMGNYSQRCLDVSREICEELGIKFHVYDIEKELGESMLKIHKRIKRKNKLNSCAICGVYKKWIMNKEAKRMNVDYIATGHNLDDEAQTFFMNILKGAPKLSANTGIITKNPEGIKTGKFIPRIKPLFFVLEEDVRKYAKLKNLRFIEGKCPYSEISYRIELRNFLEKQPEEIKENIIKNFEKIYPRLEKMKDSRMKFCEICGEPSRNDICKKCQLMRIK